MAGKIMNCVQLKMPLVGDKTFILTVWIKMSVSGQTNWQG
jgi:hypothetical protein